jgi:RNA polymerase sigma-70 factor (ECF subfamily)
MFGLAKSLVATETNAHEEFENVALPHADRLFRAAANVLGDRAAAEDVVQEVYLQAWKNFRRFQPGTDCAAWLFKIMFNTISHHRRKWLKREIVPEDSTSLEQALVYAAPVPEQIEDEEILAALDRLPAEYREVVLLADVEEFSYKEVADILRIPIGTVMSRLSRARAQLRNVLAGVANSFGIGIVGRRPVQAQTPPPIIAHRRSGIFSPVPVFME